MPAAGVAIGHVGRAGNRRSNRLEEEASARAQIFLLLALIDDERLDDAGLDALLAQARSLADQLAGRAIRRDGGTIPPGDASDEQASGGSDTA